MKLVTKNNDTNTLYALKGLLEENGIPAFVADEHAVRMVNPILFSGASLWVYVDEQWEDAMALLENPDHEVANPLAVDHFYATLQADDKPLLNRALLRLFGVVLVWILGLLLVVMLLHRMLS
ncbi:MAG: DUF2007 domain-containing protein [Candidatus Thiodiazotropha sp.]